MGKTPTSRVWKPIEKFGLRGSQSHGKVSIELGNVGGKLTGLLFHERRQGPKLQGAIRTLLFVLEDLLVPLVCFVRVKPRAVLAFVATIFLGGVFLGGVFLDCDFVVLGGIGGGGAGLLHCVCQAECTEGREIDSGEIPCKYQSQISNPTKFCCTSFRFESYDMFRKLMLTSILALVFDDLNSQIIAATLFVLFNLCVTALFNPYTHSSTDRLSFYLCLSLLLMLIAGMGHNFSKLLYEQAISSGDVIKLVAVGDDLSTSEWQTLIFAANIFGYACIAFEFLTHPYHLLEHHASFLTIKYGTKVKKNDIFKALFGCLDRNHPSYGPILEHHTASMAGAELGTENETTTKNTKLATTKVTPLSPALDSVNVVDESNDLKVLKSWDSSSEPDK